MKSVEGRLDGDRGAERHPLRPGGRLALARGERGKHIARDADERSIRGCRAAPEHAAPELATPNQSGLPGRCATLWNTLRTPSSVESLRHEVELAHRDAAAQDEHVVSLQVKFQPAPERGQVVDDVIVRDSLEAVQPQRRGDGVGIRAADLVRQNGLAGLDRARCPWR